MVAQSADLAFRKDASHLVVQDLLFFHHDQGWTGRDESGEMSHLPWTEEA